MTFAHGATPCSGPGSARSRRGAANAHGAFVLVHGRRSGAGVNAGETVLSTAVAARATSRTAP